MNQYIQNPAFAVDGSPQVHFFLHRTEYSVQRPSAIRSWPVTPDPTGTGRPELKNPTPNGHIGDIKAVFGDEILGITETHRETAILPHRMLNDLGWETVAFAENLERPPRLPVWGRLIQQTNLTAPVDRIQAS